jgi:hypothetical protein
VKLKFNLVLFYEKKENKGRDVINCLREKEGERDREVDFADRFAVAGGTITVASDTAEGLIANNFRSIFNITVENEFIRTMNFVIG